MARFMVQEYFGSVFYSMGSILRKAVILHFLLFPTGHHGYFLVQRSNTFHFMFRPTFADHIVGHASLPCPFYMWSSKGKAYSGHEVTPFFLDHSTASLLLPAGFSYQSYSCLCQTRYRSTAALPTNPKETSDPVALFVGVF